MNKGLEKLIEIKKYLNEQLLRAEERNDFLTCIDIDYKLDEVDAKIREIATEEEWIELHIKGLI